MNAVLPGAIIGYRKSGKPIRLIAGGASEDEGVTTPPSGKTYTREEFEAALAAEREKRLPLRSLRPTSVTPP